MVDDAEHASPFVWEELDILTWDDLKSLCNNQNLSVSFEYWVFVS